MIFYKQSEKEEHMAERNIIIAKAGGTAGEGGKGMGAGADRRKGYGAPKSAGGEFSEGVQAGAAAGLGSVCL